MNNNERRPRRFSVLAIFAVVAVLGSIFAMRTASRRVTKELLQITTGSTAPIVTTEAEKDADDIPDPRTTTTAQELSQPTTATPTTTTATTAPATKAQTAAAAPVNTTFILPLKETSVLKGYAPATLVYSATMGDWRTHSGVDFTAQTGDEVLSVGNGTVTKVISDTRWGYIVEVDYGTFTARYCALSQDGTVGIDTVLHTGDVIGTLASVPMESAETPHLHFEAMQNGKAVDPLAALGIDA